MEFPVLRLGNGLRVVVQQVESPISHACLLIDAGARDEDKPTYGLAHFIEHLLFKRTERRTTSQILNRLETVGADLNAYTTKEYTCIHASFLNPYLQRTLDLFEDLVFHSVFPDEEIEKERSVILDEIASYQDSPEDSVMDEFEDLIFEGHQLGHNILGAESSVKSITRQDMLTFVARHYHPSKMVLGISGKYSLAQVKRVVERLFAGKSSGVPNGLDGPSFLLSDTESVQMSSSNRMESRRRPINQVHQVIGSRAYSIADSRRMGLMLLNNLLGGMGMSSKLNLVVREQHGIAYTIESSYVPFSDTGLFSIYFGTDLDKYEKANRLVLRELKKLRDSKLGSGQLHLAKKKFKGQMALGEENRLSLLIVQAKSLMDFDRVERLEDVFARIDAVHADELLEIANEVFDENRLYTLRFLPE